MAEDKKISIYIINNSNEIQYFEEDASKSIFMKSKKIFISLATSRGLLGYSKCVSKHCKKCINFIQASLNNKNKTADYFTCWYIAHVLFEIYDKDKNAKVTLYTSINNKTKLEKLSILTACASNLVKNIFDYDYNKFQHYNIKQLPVVTDLYKYINNKIVSNEINIEYNQENCSSKPKSKKKKKK